MSIFKKTLASVLGVGGSRIDTRLEQESYQPGELMHGELHIQGGDVSQDITEVYLDVMTHIEVQTNNGSRREEACLQRGTITVQQTVTAGERVVIPFTFALSENTPITAHKSQIWMRTQLAIAQAVDQYDRDLIQIVPDQGLHTVISVLQEAGFTLREVENKVAGGQVIQEFEWVPTRGSFSGRLDELETTYLVYGNEVHLYIQVDRKVRGVNSFFAEKMGTDESHFRLVFTHQQILDPYQVRDHLLSIIQRNC